MQVVAPLRSRKGAMRDLYGSRVKSDVNQCANLNNYQTLARLRNALVRPIASARCFSDMDRFPHEPLGSRVKSDVSLQHVDAPNI
ncbi:hypothetical protein Tco_0007665 [Tanacetum coccineum]